MAAGSTTLIDLDDVRSRAGVPPDAKVTALALTLTAVGAQQPGFLTATPCGTTSNTSNVNYFDQSPSPNLVLVSPNEAGEVCITTLASTNIIVDLFGVFTQPTHVVPSDVPSDVPTSARADRILDTRLTGGLVAPGTTVQLDVGNSSGVALNLTAVDATAPGFLSAFPCAGGLPKTSSVNFANAVATSNAVIVSPDSDGKICVYSLGLRT